MKEISKAITSIVKVIGIILYTYLIYIALTSVLKLSDDILLQIVSMLGAFVVWLIGCFFIGAIGEM